MGRAEERDEDHALGGVVVRVVVSPVAVTAVVVVVVVVVDLATCAPRAGRPAA